MAGIMASRPGSNGCVQRKVSSSSPAGCCQSATTTLHRGSGLQPQARGSQSSGSPPPCLEVHKSMASFPPSPLFLAPRKEASLGAPRDHVMRLMTWGSPVNPLLWSSCETNRIISIKQWEFGQLIDKMATDGGCLHSAPTVCGHVSEFRLGAGVRSQHNVKLLYPE